jgi:alcohol dehydrogenase, propanol-preferring
MAKLMKAAVAREFGKPLEIMEIPIPEVESGQVLVKVAACGVCHTDLHAVEGDWPVKPGLPFVPGHEGVGTVVAVGPGVRGVREGDRVGMPWLASACGECEWCRTGWETYCPQPQYRGYTVNGGFAEYVAADARYVGRIPKNLSFPIAAPILCAGVTTYKGLLETEARPGQWVAISGIGGLGHIAVQYAIAMGLQVAAIDTSDDKLQLARECGAGLVVNCREEDPGKVLQREIGGAHGVLVTAPSLDAFKQAVAMTRRKGTCVLVGLPPGEFPVDLFDVVLRRITIRGSLVGTRQDLEESLQFAAEGAVKPHIDTVPLACVNKVLDRLRAGNVQGRLVLTMEGENALA